MKASKFIVLVGGILGIISFFLPMASVTEKKDGADIHVSVSAFQVVKGIDSVTATVNGNDAHKMGEGLSGADKAEFDTAKKDANKALSDAKGIIIGLFVPAFLLALVGGFAVMRKRMGRGAGTLAFLLGIAALGIGALLKSALEGDSGLALTMLMVTGAAGIIGGLMTLVKPDRGMATG